MAAKRQGRRMPPERIAKVVHANARLEAHLGKRTWGIALGGTLLVILSLACAFIEHLGP